METEVKFLGGFIVDREVDSTFGLSGSVEDFQLVGSRDEGYLVVNSSLFPFGRGMEGSRSLSDRRVGVPSSRLINLIRMFEEVGLDDSVTFRVHCN